eukprot:TRINITY_DN1156_c1_g1_i1.p2 TRINITY_DN1156_c1_g1~~TRINITY_DN1156_c1_g1_i1.p2  ORF type:complete len:200 (+),score=-14.17 TRINITY_DN1156_c1_g1_i1:699-1298(+)
MSIKQHSHISKLHIQISTLYKLNMYIQQAQFYSQVSQQFNKFNSRKFWQFKQKVIYKTCVIQTKYATPKKYRETNINKFVILSQYIQKVIQICLLKRVIYTQIIIRKRNSACLNITYKSNSQKTKYPQVINYKISMEGTLQLLMFVITIIVIITVLCLKYLLFLLSNVIVKTNQQFININSFIVIIIVFGQYFWLYVLY